MTGVVNAPPWHPDCKSGRAVTSASIGWVHTSLEAQTSNVEQWPTKYSGLVCKLFITLTALNYCTAMHRHLSHPIVLLLLLLLPLAAAAQRTQRIKGRVLDKDSKSPLPGVTVAITNIDPPIGTATDTNGYYTLDQVPVGKQTVTFSYMGYRQQTASDVLVTSAKEVMLPMELEESAQQMSEVVITRKKEHINDMALVSARTFDVQETERYAGSRSDPARMASNFAGAQGGNDSRNDIVVRGNSPQGVLWRLEGVDIPNPNHFAIPGTTGGPVSMLNSKTLANSEFFMGAFTSEYGNAVAGVFDLKLRNGNNDRYEFTGQLGFLGTEFTAEGPISRKQGSSFLVNYRYSTLQLFQGMNIKIGTTSVPNYQDASFRLNFPIGKKSNLAIYGLGGNSGIDLVVSTLTEPAQQLYGESDRDQYFKSSAGIVGATYGSNINKTTYMQVSVAATGSYAWALHTKVYRNADFKIDSMKDVLWYDFTTGTATAHWSVTKKLSARQTIKAGLLNNYFQLSLTDSSRQYPANRQTWQVRENYRGGTNLAQAYVQYKYRPTDNLAFTGGLHAQYLSHNGASSLEPRLGMKWTMRPGNTLSAGYGLHSQMQQLYQYFALDANGVMQNQEIGFTRSHHAVLGYGHVFSPSLRLQLETYGQYLFAVPVEQRVGSSYSALNQGSTFSRDFPGPLQNTGTGYNYGLELTLEKAFGKGYYALFTGSVFDSKAAGNDGVYRNTDFNTGYAFNILAGYEKRIGKYSTLITGAKATFIGGKRYSPVNRQASDSLGDMVVIDDQRNTLQFRSYFRTDLKVGIRINSRRLTHEVALDLVNVANTQNILSLTYSPDLAAQGKDPFLQQYQLGFLPIFYYRVDLGLKKKEPKQ